MSASHTLTETPAHLTPTRAAVPPRSARWPILMLFSRIVLFAAFQAIFALGFRLAGSTAAWEASAAWWPFTVTFANLVCVGLLIHRFRQESGSYFDLWHFERRTLVRDLLTVLVIFAISGVIAMLPNQALAVWIYGDYMLATNLFIRELPVWAAWLSLTFAVTQGFAELPVYFGYVMPRLDAVSGKKWLGFAAASLMLSAQHMAVPLLFDARFLLWRGLMFLPFALFIGACLRWRPRLFPYILIGHMLIDVATVAMVILKANGQM